MISREEAREILKEMHDYMHEGYITDLAYGGKQDETMERNIEALSVAIKELSQPPADQWIPYERLPKPFERVKVLADGKPLDAVYYGRKGLLLPHEWYGKGFYRHDENYGYCKIDGVTAWMPLPEPYKEVE